MKRTLNFRFLFLLLAVAAIVAFVGSVLHARQLKQNASYLLAQAGQAVSGKDFPKALSYLNHYLTFRPEDGRARARYGVILARRAKSAKEFEFAYMTIERALRDAPGLEQVLRDDPELRESKKNPDAEIAALANDEVNIRQLAAQLSVVLGEFADAKVHLEAALRDSPKDADLLLLLGECEESLGKPVPAIQHYESAIASRPSLVAGYVFLANLHRRVGKPAEADAVVKRLVATNPDDVRARLAAVDYYIRTGERAALDAASENLAAAKAGALKDDREILLASAKVAIAKKDEPEARENLRRGIELYPAEPQSYLMLAELDVRAGKREDAVALLRKAVGFLPKQSAAVWFVADLLIDADERAEARALVTRLGEEKADAVAVLDARLLLAEGKAKKAEKLLRASQAQFARKPVLALRTELLLAACYERLAKPDLRLKAARQAASLEPTSLPARLAHAGALLAVGKLDEAITEYRGAYEVSPQVRFTVARLQIALGRLESADETLDGLPRELRDTANALLARAMVRANSPKKEERDRARLDVEAARDKFPKETAFWVFLAITCPEPKDGLALLDKAQAEVGNGADIRLARANLLLRQKADPAAFRALEAGAETLPDAERAALSRGLATAHMMIDSHTDAERLLRQAADRQPGDLDVLFRLFELVSAKADPQVLDELCNKLKEAEDDSGAMWRLVDAYKLWREYLGGQKPKALEDARKQLGEAGKSRPEWFWVPLLQGKIEDQQGKVDAAIELYVRAIRLGASRPEDVVRATTLLLGRRRVDEAHQLIADLRRRSPALPQQLEQLDLRAEARRGADPDHLLKQLTKAAPESSTNARDHLIRAGVFVAVNQPKDAEAAFRKAVALDSAAPEPWVSLVYFLARTDRVAEAKAEIANAAKSVAAAKRAQALGACHEAVGERAEAEKHYAQAAAGTPADPADLRALATFYLGGGETEKAEPILRRLVADPANCRWANRALALALAGGGYEKATKALELLEQNLRESPGNPEDLRTKSLILASRPGGRAQAIKDLESSFVRLPPAPAEEFLLARMYELDGDWAKANERMVLAVTRRGGDTPVFLANYVAALLRHKDVVAAERWLVKLKEKTKGSSAQLVELQARVDVARGRKDEAARAVKAFARETHAANPDPLVLRSCGTLLAELRLMTDAEELFREYVRTAEPKSPEAVLVLADFMARYQNRVGDALVVCSEAVARVNPEQVAQQAVAVVRLGDATEAHFAQAEEIVRKAAKAKPASADIPVSLADLRDAQARYADAKSMYREILRAAPQNALAMNNLAWLLALHEGEKDEALGILELAVRLRGPNGDLLDTRGVVHLTAGESAKAIADLTKSVAEEARPERYFHLAQAYQKAGNTPEALRAMRKAVADHGLTKKDLHRLEWKAFDEMLGLIGER